MQNASAGDDPSLWLDTHARLEPERPLLETGDGRRLSYSQMAACTRLLAAALVALEVAPGDRVVAQIEKSDRKSVV